MNEAQWWIDHLGLAPHPEGGYFRETYRSTENVQSSRGLRSAATAIYYLLGPGHISALHRLRSDEIFHHYAGAAYAIYEIAPDGTLSTTMLGNNVRYGEVPQHVVRAGHWFGSDVPDGDFALVGCTVSPGFEYGEFELADRAVLTARWPQHEALIARLTPQGDGP